MADGVIGKYEIISKEAIDAIRVELNTSLEKSIALVNQLAQATQKISGAKNIKELKDETNNLNTVNVQLKNSQDEVVKAQLKYQQVSQEQKKVLKDQIILEDKEAGTLEKLAAKNRLLEAQKKKLDLETKKGQKTLKEINKEQDKNNKLIEQSGNKLQKQKINIGNYGSAFSGLTRPIQMAGNALKAFLANPVVAIIAGIVAAFSLLKKAMTRSEEGQDRLNKIMKVAGSIWDNIIDLVTMLGVALFDNFPKFLKKTGNVFEIFTNNMVKGWLNIKLAFNKIFDNKENITKLENEIKIVNNEIETLKIENIELNKQISSSFAELIEKRKGLRNEVEEDIKKAKELADIEAKYNKDERKYILENAKYINESAKLRAEAEEQKKTNANESIILMEKAFDADEKVLSNELKLAETRLDILKRKSALSVDDIATKKEIALAEADLFNKESAFDEKRRERTRRLNIMRMEAFKQQTERSKALLEIEKNNNNTLIKQNEDLIKSDETTFNEKYNAITINSKLLERTAAKELEIEKSNIEKEKELKLINEEDANIQLLALESKYNNEVIKIESDKAEKLKKLIEDELNAKLEAAELIKNTISEGSNVVTSIMNREEVLTNRYYDSKIKAAEKAGRDTTKIEQEKARKIAEIQRKQAILNKAIALAEIAFNTGKAVMAVASTGGGTYYADFGISAGVLTALTIATGAMQAAAVLAEPLPEIPKFFEGKKKSDSYSGLAVVGDAPHGGSSTELINLPDNRQFLVKEPTVIDLPKGSEVIPEKDLQNNLANLAVQGREYIADTNLDKLGEKIIKGIKGIKGTTYITKGNTLLEIIKDNYRRQCINKRFRHV